MDEVKTTPASNRLTLLSKCLDRSKADASTRENAMEILKAVEKLSMTDGKAPASTAGAIAWLVTPIEVREFDIFIASGASIRTSAIQIATAVIKSDDPEIGKAKDILKNIVQGVKFENSAWTEDLRKSEKQSSISKAFHFLHR